LIVKKTHQNLIGDVVASFKLQATSVDLVSVVFDMLMDAWTAFVLNVRWLGSSENRKLVETLYIDGTVKNNQTNP
jgi:hypothetical protein